MKPKPCAVNETIYPITKAVGLGKLSEEEFAKQLTDMVAKGDLEGARAKARLIVASGRSASIALDAILEGYNIAADLHTLGEEDQERFDKSEQAAKSAIETIETYLHKTQIRTDAKVAVGSVASSRDLTSRIAAVMLKVAGFKVWEMHARGSSKELLMNAEQTGVDVLLACLPNGDTGALSDFLREVRAGNFAKRITIAVLVPDYSSPFEEDIVAAAARNPTEAVSRVMEVLMRKGKLVRT
jgi:methylmalonyl-CoA mutase cobalamin-binding subunit